MEGNFNDISEFLNLIPMIISLKPEVKRKTVEEKSYFWNDDMITIDVKKNHDLWHGTFVEKCPVNGSSRAYNGCFS